MATRENRNLIPLLLLGCIAIVAVNAWLSFRAVETLLQSESEVQRTWEAVNQVERVVGAAKDAETGERGFLITGNESYLAPYLSAVSALPGELDSLKSLAAGNPSQQARLLEMRAALTRRLAILKQSIDLRRTGNRDTLSELTLSGTGKAEMDQLRRIADQTEGEERRLLAIRIADAKASGRRAGFTTALASTLDLFLIILAFRYFAREHRLRIASQVLAGHLDLTRAEAEAHASQVRLLNATLEERILLRTAELEATNRELEAFSYSVSHDLRAPLRTIDGFSLALEEDYASAVGEAGKDYIRRVRGGVRRMGELIDALLQLSRITRAEIARQPVDLSALALSVMTELREQAPDRHITFNVASGLQADGDPKLLRIALENLLGNAVKFTSKVQHAIIDFGWDAEQNAWSIRDNGAGFDMYYAEKLFNAFNRLHGDKDFKGSGIGLATVARVVRRHRGRIWAASAIDLGATFWFTLG